MKSRFAACLLALILASPVCAGVGQRYEPIVTFEDDRGVVILNNNFRRFTETIVGDVGVDVVVSSNTSSVNVAFANAQDDLSYAVFVQTSWDAGARVLQKSTTGFLVQCSTPGAGGGTFDWILFK